MRKKKKEKDQKHTNMPESGVVRSLTVSKGETGLYYNVSLCREKQLSVFRSYKCHKESNSDQQSSFTQ